MNSGAGRVLWVEPFVKRLVVSFSAMALLQQPFSPQPPFATLLVLVLQQPLTWTGGVSPCPPALVMSFISDLQQPVEFAALLQQSFPFPQENVCAASNIGRYPVQRHRLPSNVSSTACSEGLGSLRSRAYRLYKTTKFELAGIQTTEGGREKQDVNN